MAKKETEDTRPVQLKVYVSKNAHAKLKTTAKDEQVSMSQIVEELVTGM